jgi:hypothetical protein
METNRFEIESKKPFSESLIWQINRDFYDKEGIDAWSDGTVPHHLTSNSMVGRTYAELIFGFLKDLSQKGQTQETVYLIELGAGHGRLAFHILKHLEKLTDQPHLKLPPYCYILSDIVEDNLSFFQNHKQFQPYFESGLLDVAYFDAIEGNDIDLRIAGKKISHQNLNQPLMVIANYFFDSIPKDLYHFSNTKISTCTVSINSQKNPNETKLPYNLEDLDLKFHFHPTPSPTYENPIFNEILESYRLSLFNTYLFFPHNGFKCLDNLKKLSKQGMILLSMDKGYHELHDLENAKPPDMVAHGSMSFWVNYHAFGAYCEKIGGKVRFPQFSTFHLELGCFFFLPNSDTFSETHTAYQRFVDDFGPDDFTGMKKFTYKHIAEMTLRELIGMLRLSHYDSAMFMNVLPRIKQVYQQITFNDRNRLFQTMNQTWNMYFSLNEKEDMAFEIGGMLYDLGYYREALGYFGYSVSGYGETADVFYNQALCYFQLREDTSFLKTIKAGKVAFPNYRRFQELEGLDLGAS